MGKITHQYFSFDGGRGVDPRIVKAQKHNSIFLTADAVQCSAEVHEKWMCFYKFGYTTNSSENYEQFYGFRCSVTVLVIKIEVVSRMETNFGSPKEGCNV